MSAGKSNKQLFLQKKTHHLLKIYLFFHYYSYGVLTLEVAEPDKKPMLNFSAAGLRSLEGE